MKIKTINQIEGIDPALFMSGVEEISLIDMPFEVKAPKKNKSKVLLTIEGYASTSSRDADGEIILPSAFDDTLDFFLTRGITLFMHNWYMIPIGKTYEAATDSIGLYVKADVMDTTDGRDVATMIEAGVLDSFSIGFGSTKRNEDDDTIIEKLKLYENSIVNLGSNPDSLFDLAKERKLNIKSFSLGDFHREDKKEKGKRTMAKDFDFEAKVRQLEGMFDEKADAIDSMQTKVDSLSDNIDKQANLIKMIAEKAESFQKGLITKDEYTQFATNVGNDIQEIQTDIQEAKKAIRAKSQRIPISDWKSLAADKDLNFVFNDLGQPLNRTHQKANLMFYAPVEYNDSAEGQLLKNLRDLHDSVYLANVYMKGINPTMHNITKLKSYQLFVDIMQKYDPEFYKAMYSTGTGVGDEWVPTGMSNQLYEAYELAGGVEGTFPVFNMKANPDQYPLKTSHARMYRASEADSNNPNTLTKSNFGTSNITFTAEKFAVAIPVSDEWIEDSIISVVPELRKELAYALKDGADSWIINADNTTAGTHMDTAAAWATDTIYPESYGKGLRKLAIAGSRTYNAQAAGVLTSSDIRATRALLPAAYAHRATDITYVTTLAVWIDILSLAEMTQFGTYAAAATWKTGELTMFDGSPLLLTSNMSDTMAATGLKTGSDSTSGLLCYNKTAFKVGQRRGVTVEFEKNILTKQWSFVADMRKDFKSMDASGSEAVSYLINIP